MEKLFQYLYVEERKFIILFIRLFVLASTYFPFPYGMCGWKGIILFPIIICGCNCLIVDGNNL